MGGNDVFRWGVREERGLVILEFRLTRPLKPDEMRQIQTPPIYGEKLLVLSGRGPIWLYSYLTHLYAHVFKGIAIFDPKLGGAVVTVSHVPEIKVGDVIKLPE